MSDSVLDRIRLLLESRALPFREVHHSPTNTSEESAKARGEDVAIGSKAILMKVGDEFKLFVLSAAKKIDSQKIKSKFGSKRRRFASLEECKVSPDLFPAHSLLLATLSSPLISASISRLLPTRRLRSTPGPLQHPSS